MQSARFAGVEHAVARVRRVAHVAFEHVLRIVAVRQALDEPYQLVGPLPAEHLANQVLMALRRRQHYQQRALTEAAQRRQRFLLALFAA